MIYDKEESKKNNLFNIDLALSLFFLYFNKLMHYFYHEF